jgi:hypothetical protein
VSDNLGPNVSMNCRIAQGLPKREHYCTGGVCECSCHGTAPPDNFRELVAEARRAAKEAG